MTVTHDKKVLTLKEAGEAIRKTWRGGRKTIQLWNGKTWDTFNISRQDKPVSFSTGGITVKRTESWLVAKPADGRLVPTYNVEYKRLANLRSAASSS